MATRKTATAQAAKRPSTGHPSSPSGRASLVPWLGWAAIVLVLDQFTKTLILGYYQLGDSTPVTAFFNIVRVHNHGAAFAFLSDAGGWQRWFFTGIGLAAAVFMLWMLKSHPGQKLFSFAVSSLLGGAIGNVVDRMLHGYVVDFLDVHARWLEPLFTGGHFPAFNLADSAITLGAICLILDELRRVQRGR
jgi:signal peptidase II